MREKYVQGLKSLFNYLHLYLIYKALKQNSLFFAIIIVWYHRYLKIYNNNANPIIFIAYSKSILRWFLLLILINIILLNFTLNDTEIAIIGLWALWKTGWVSMQKKRSIVDETGISFSAESLKPETKKPLDLLEVGRY